MESPSLEARAHGCIIGGACGDALGGPFEGLSPAINLRWPDKLRISDDTQLTLATCEAIIETGDVNPESIAERFLAWFRAGRLTGLGSSTLKALRDLEVGTHWALSGARGERAAGAGAAMRIAPLAFLLDPNSPEDRTRLRDVCRITHHHDEAYLGALAVVIAIRLVTMENHFLSHDLLTAVIERLPDSQVRDKLDHLADIGSKLSLLECAERHGTSGFVAEAVPFAILAAAKHGNDGLSQVLPQTIACGGDTDTIASITGQITGAALGKCDLLEREMRKLIQFDQVKATAQQFAAKVRR